MATRKQAKEDMCIAIYIYIYYYITINKNTKINTHPPAVPKNVSKFIKPQAIYSICIYY
jgi:hypothetical protein